MTSNQVKTACAAALTVCVTMAPAAEVPFVEDFTSNSANWYNNPGNAPVQWSDSDGPDGGAHAYTTFNFVNSREGDIPTFFRAQDEFNSSDGAFEGNWIDDGVEVFTAYVRHDAPAPATFFVRFSQPANFPGGIAIVFQPVPPNVWTQLEIPIRADNPQFVTFEGSDFQTVFSNIGHVQVGVQVTQGLAGINGEFVFDLDKAAIDGEGGGGCTGREKLTAKCGNKRCGYRVTGKLSKAEPNVEVTLLLDGADGQTVTTKKSGKAKVKWCGLGAGSYEVSLEGCELATEAVCRN